MPKRSPAIGAAPWTLTSVMTVATAVLPVTLVLPLVVVAVPPSFRVALAKENTFDPVMYEAAASAVAVSSLRPSTVSFSCGMALSETVNSHCPTLHPA
jgi:hypothetical protein